MLHIADILFFLIIYRQTSKQRSRGYMDKELVVVSNLQ